MPGDYSRFTHDPRDRYSGVLTQQGRVHLDADDNEQVEIVRRRWETQATDTFGPCAVPRAATPDGFLLTSPTLAIGVGRLYADGLLAEVFDGEAFTYASQPFYPVPPPLAGLAGPNGLAYLDVWEREVTSIEDPDLLEVALGGPDTTTRTQTVWQVKVHPTGQVTASCQEDLDALFPPSGGRLSTRAMAPPLVDDVCLLPPSGGYRGLENRLYRVEVHTGGDLTQARFKWSRDNASLATRVEALGVSGTQTTLTVSRIGRDEVLRFQAGDWVEVTDDVRELMGEPGEMARIAAPPDEATRTLTLDRALPSAGARPFGANPAQLAERHTRVRRWDQQQNIVVEAGVATGLVAVAGGGAWLALEDGIEVQFALNPAATGRFHVGDYWVFAARTADASVEVLDEAPPRGIVHHYCPLATLSGLGPGGGTPAVVEDCRTLWPPLPGGGEGCCTVVVQPGESIQEALDSLPAGVGGCVCLKAGVHDIRAPIRVEKSRVTLHGEAAGAAIVVNRAGVNVLTLRGPDGAPLEDIVVADLVLVAGGQPGTDEDIALLLGLRVEELTIRECRFRVEGAAGEGAGVFGTLGVFLQFCRQAAVYDCRLDGLMGGIWAQHCQEVTAARNRMSGAIVRVPTAAAIVTTAAGHTGINLQGRTSGRCRVEDNDIADFLHGIVVARNAAFSIIAANRVVRPNVRIPVGDNAASAERRFAIDVDAPGCLITGNLVPLSDGQMGGIRVRESDTLVTQNTITSTLAEAGALIPMGILAQPQGERRIRNLVVRANTLSGIQAAIGAISPTPLGIEGAQICGNDIHGFPRRLVTIGVGLANVAGCLVENNRIQQAARAVFLIRGTNNRVVANDLEDAERGIDLWFEQGPEVVSNRVENVRGPGLVALQPDSLYCAHNRLSACGYGEQAAGILVLGALGDQRGGAAVRIDACDVTGTGASRDGKERTTATAVAGIGVLFARECRLQGNRVVGAPDLPNTAVAQRAVFLAGTTDSSARAELSDNVAAGTGGPYLVEMLALLTPQKPSQPTFGKVVFANNRCEQARVLSPANRRGATVFPSARHVCVSGNQVRADSLDQFSFDFDGTEFLTAVGNVTSGRWLNVPAAAGRTRPAPPDNFNHIAVP